MFINAQGFQVNLQGQKQQGMAGAGTGLMQDPAAVFFNPGGVSFLQGNGATVGMTPTFANGTFLDADNNSVAHSNAPVGTPFTAYVVWGPDSSKFKFGFGVYTPFGSIASWPDNWTGRFALTYMKLQAITTNLPLVIKYAISWALVQALYMVQVMWNLRKNFLYKMQTATMVLPTLRQVPRTMVLTRVYIINLLINFLLG